MEKYAYLAHYLNKDGMEAAYIRGNAMGVSHELMVSATSEKIIQEFDEIKAKLVQELAEFYNELRTKDLPDLETIIKMDEVFYKKGS